MSRLINPWIQYLDENGDPYAFATVYFGLPNQDPVTNPKAPFSDKFTSVAIGTSQVLDKRGMLETAIYLDGAYSVSLFDAENNQIRTDPEVVGALSGTVISFTTIATAKAEDDLQDFIGGYIRVADYTAGNPIDALYQVVAGNSTDNGGTIHNSDSSGLFYLALVAYDVPNLYVWGAVSGQDSTTAIINYIAHNGQLEVPKGNFQLTDITIDVPISFDLGGSIECLTGNTVTIHSTIDSPRQFILRGDGDYLIEHDGTSGEDSRNVHVSWFNVFPGDLAVDSAIPLQKLNDSIGNVRECLIQFDVGTYYHATGVLWTRGAKVLGAGDRLTNIWVQFLTGDVWETNGDASNFHGLQFNADSIRTSGAYIRLSHNRCETYDIYMDKGFEGVVLDDVECEAHRTKGLTWSQVAGSSLIRVAADDCLVETVNYTSSTPVGPEYVVRIGSDTATISRPRIYDIYARTDQDIVGVVSSAFTVNESLIMGVTGRECVSCVVITVDGSSSPNSTQIVSVNGGLGCTSSVKLITSSTGSIFGVSMDDISSNSQIGNGIEITNDGSGNIRPVTIGQHDLRADIGMKIGGTGNPPENISIGNGGARNCATRGYDITAKQWTMSSGTICSSNPNDVTINVGSATFIIQGGFFGGGIIDNSGAVTKIIADNL